MLGLLLTTFLPSLLSVVSSTSEYLKNSEGYPSSGFGISASRGGRDRRTTHWESRSRSNLDDDRLHVDVDRDRGHGQISYPLLVDQLSALRFPTSPVELSGKSSNEIDVPDDKNVDNDSMHDRCTTMIQNPILFVSIAGARRCLDVMRDLQLSPASTDRFETMRCRRRIEGWRVQKPVYVEEPRWIVIDLNRQNGPDHSMSDDDPFYVARGKRSVQLLNDIRRARTKKDLTVTSTDFTDSLTSEEDSASGIQEKNQPTVSRRKKRDALSDAFRSSLFEDRELGFGGRPGFGASGGKVHACVYVGPRNKHSEILDILNEPFFISRGKKDSTRIRRMEFYNRYVRKKNVNDNILTFGETRNRATSIGNCDPRLNDCFVDSLTIGSQVDPRSVANPSAFRGRRGILEDLLRRGDPFYIARGKRSPSTSTTQRLNENLSQHSWSYSSTDLLNERPTVPSSISQSPIQNINENLSIVH